jgi:signal transduction histidine kinase
MRLIPRSLYGRLLAAALVATLAALAFAGLAIGAVLEHFVMQGLDQRLDAQIALLATAVRPDGSIDRARIVSPAPFDRQGPGPDSNWGWRIDSPTGTIAPDLPQIDQPPDPPHHRERRRDKDGPDPLDWYDSYGGARHARSLSIATSAGPVRIIASAPNEIVKRPIRAAMAPLLGSLALLGLALAVATLVQLRIGLRPLGRLREALAAVRAGKASSVPADQPSELAPLARELNALLAENEAALANARGHVANLAHGLKTPLATLALALREGRDPDGALAAEVERIDRSIRHHLGRARADASGGAVRRRTLLAPAVEGVAGALSRIHADRGVIFTADIPPGLALAVDPQDLDELLGNLLDNGWRWAARRITLTASADPPTGRARIAIEDDGPGIKAEDRAEALRPGRRLDERGAGHGFGLSIARELVELSGGSLQLDSPPGGGLAAIVTLPLAGANGWPSSSERGWKTPD